MNQTTDPAGNDLTAEEIYIARRGFFNMWICAPSSWSIEQVQAALDAKAAEGDIDSGWVAGTEHGWQAELCTEHEDQGMLSPGLCALAPKERVHWNCVC